MNPLTADRANAIYDILVKAGAINDQYERDCFVREVTGENPTSEYRFCGKFGFSGKYRPEKNKIDYRDDWTESDRLALNALRDETNRALALLDAQEPHHNLD